MSENDVMAVALWTNGKWVPPERVSFGSYPLGRHTIGAIKNCRGTRSIQWAVKQDNREKAQARRSRRMVSP